MTYFSTTFDCTMILDNLLRNDMFCGPLWYGTAASQPACAGRSDVTVICICDQSLKVKSIQNMNIAL